MRKVTYSKSITISLTHACVNMCAYCIFRVRNAGLTSQEYVNDCIKRGKEKGCAEVLIMSGDSPGQLPEVQKDLIAYGYDSYIEFVQDVCKKILAMGMLPHVNIGCISFEEMRALKPFVASMGLMLESINPFLDAHKNAATKDPNSRLEVIRNAGILKIPFTTGILVGIGESVEDRVEALTAIAREHAKYGHVQEIIIQNFVPKMGTPMEAVMGVSPDDMAKVVATARKLTKDICIQIPPNLNPGTVVQLLRAGANDLGGISVDEDYINPEMPWPEVCSLEELLGPEGFKLQHRLAVYPKYENKEWLSSKVLKVINRLRNSH